MMGSDRVYRGRQRIDRIIITCPYEQLEAQRQWLYEHGYRIADTQRQWHWDKDARNEDGYPIKRLIYLDRWTLTGERPYMADNREPPTA